MRYIEELKSPDLLSNNYPYKIIINGKTYVEACKSGKCEDFTMQMALDYLFNNTHKYIYQMYEGVRYDSFSICSY